MGFTCRARAREPRIPRYPMTAGTRTGGAQLLFHVRRAGRPMNPLPGVRNPERRRIRDELVNVLENSQVIRDVNSRQLVLEELADLSPPVRAREHSVLRLHLHAIVKECARADAIADLVAIVAHLEPDSQQTRQAQRLGDQWEAVDQLSAADYAALRPVLEAVTPVNLAVLYQEATAHRLVGPPPWCVDAWQAFVHLAGQNAGADGVPPHMLFLTLLESEIGADGAQRLRSWTQRRATEFELTGALDSWRARADGGGQSVRDSTAYLVVQIAPDLDPDRIGCYQLSYSRQWRGPDGWHSLQGLVVTVQRQELERRVESIVDTMEREWADRAGTVAVEFVLPWELLNEEVEWWRVESDSTRPTALAMDYPIVVRSLDRLSRQRWHRRWGARWRQLRSAPASSTIEVSRPDGADYAGQLESVLKADDRIVSLVLSEPPTAVGSPGQQEAEAAMRAGLPVVLWHRTDCTSETFREVINTLTADGGLADLPGRVMKLRLEALREASELRGKHVGRHLAILWDDAERKPDLIGGPEHPPLVGPVRDPGGE